jgi:transcription elongation GreA/GreB family factor
VSPPSNSLLERLDGPHHIISIWNPNAQNLFSPGGESVFSTAVDKIMSRAFVKEQDVDAPEQPLERPVSEHPNDVTPSGMAQIEQALVAAKDAYARAQSSDDRAALAAAARDLRYWSARHATARVVAAPDDLTEVRFGTSVTILRDDGRKQTFRIVGEDEADPAKGSISHISPLARSMFGKRVGDVVRAGNGEAEITSIR